MADRSGEFRLYRCMTSEMMEAEIHGGGGGGGSGFSLSRCTKVKAAAAEEEKALKKMKMEEEEAKAAAGAAKEENALKKTQLKMEEEDAKVMASVEEEEPQRKVVKGKRIVQKRMTMEKVLRVLAIDPKPVIIRESDVDPLILASKKHCKFAVDKIREFQDTIREDLRTKGYVLGWVTDDDE